MARANTIAPVAEFEYIECFWGDLVYGTREQLQALGIGRGLEFPGENGRARRKMRTTDPRGFKVIVEYCPQLGRAGQYCAHVSYFPELSKQLDRIRKSSHAEELSTADYAQRLARIAQRKAAEDEIERRMLALPRPARLDGKYRGHLQLVWSTGQSAAARE